MEILLIVLGSAAVLVLGGGIYSRFLARCFGEDANRPTPAVRFNDGVDFVPTPTPVVFAHHFASIAGAGPIIGPLLGVVFGWLPAVLWIVCGGVLIGAAHDYAATLIAMREGGRSLAVVARRTLGRTAFLLYLFLIIALLTLVTAMFLKISALALTNVASAAELGVADRGDVLAKHRFTHEGVEFVRIGGIASTSVIVITLLAPLIGWLYTKRRVNVWLCSLAALAICGVSVSIGVVAPVRADLTVWMWLVGAYTLAAAGLPVWLFLQSRDFINVHLLYGGMLLMAVALISAGLRGAPMHLEATAVLRGQELQHDWVWPALFITIACGACSGFHSLCAGGTTCKQLRSERGARHVGYWAMLLESFLAVCVVAAVGVGLSPARYTEIVYPSAGGANLNLGFSLALGNTLHAGLGLTPLAGTIFGMLLLEGFVLTTLDTAVRLNRYLYQEAWAAFFERYDVFASDAAPEASGPTALAGGLPRDSAAVAYPADALGPAAPIATTGPRRLFLRVLRSAWFNTALSAGLMIFMAFQGGVQAIWAIFASGNQLLAGLGLLLAALWLMQRGKHSIILLLPAAFMLATTLTMLMRLLLFTYLRDPGRFLALLITDVVVLLLTAGLLAHVLRVLLARGATRSSGAAAVRASS